MKPAKFCRRWFRRLSSLLDEVDELVTRCRRSGEVEDIHELRVAMRRSRVYARLGSALLGKRSILDLTKWSQTLSTVMGEVRDHDIALGWLRKKKKDYPELHQACRTRRDKLMASALPGLTTLPPSVLRAASQSNLTGSLERRIFKKYLKSLSELEVFLRQQAGRLHHLPAEEQHAFRRGVRRYRYLQELSLTGSRQKKDPLIARLVRFQKALGEMQDCVVVERVLRSLLAENEGKKLIKQLQSERKKWLAKSKRAAMALSSTTEIDQG